MKRLLLPSFAAAAVLTGLLHAAPLQVYILSGQSNMVGLGRVDSPSSRWGREFTDPVVSVYEGAYDPAKDYDSLTPIITKPIEKFGGQGPEAYPTGGVQIARGFFQPRATGIYRFAPGYRESAYCIMKVNGIEVYRMEPGGTATRNPIQLTGAEKVPFQVTHLNERGRGIGWVSRLDTPGTLHTLAKIQGKYPELLDAKGEWKSRDDFWYKGVVTARANQWLSVGCGANSNTLGPELGFGWVVGDHHDEPALILKASQGNRSLAWDFLPPGSERFEADGKVYAGYKDPKASWPIGTDPQPGSYHAGKQYDQCVRELKEVLADFDASFPHWAGRGYEIAGFAWFQGHKDAGNKVHTQRYEHNLVNLIKSLRKDFNAPNAPFVVATGCGSNGRDGNARIIAEAQLAVDGDAGKYPEFKGNVKSVDVRDFFPDVNKSPKAEGYHYHLNGGTYYEIGKAMGTAMVELLKR